MVYGTNRNFVWVPVESLSRTATKINRLNKPWERMSDEKSMGLEQVKAADSTLGWNPWYGSDIPTFITERFIEASTQSSAKDAEILSA